MMLRSGIVYVIALTICMLRFQGSIYAEKPLDLKELGSYRYTYNFLLSVYDITLYSTIPNSSEKLLSGNVPFELQFKYLRDIEKNDFIKVSNRMLEKNLSAQDISAMSDQIKSLHSAYRLVRKGDTSILRYTPSKGTTLIINGIEIVQLPSKLTCQYFRIWLGDDPICLQMREAIIGFNH